MARPAKRATVRASRFVEAVGGGRLPRSRPSSDHPDLRTRSSFERWQAGASLATAVAALGALIFTGVSIQLTRDSVQATRDQLGINERGQITDRYGRAIEQLGSPTLDVRVGAIYALERLMRDSPTDQPTLIEVLAAFVRVHSPVPAVTPKAASTPADGSGSGGGVGLVVDIQAALTVLGRRDSTHDRGVRIDLQRTHLREANQFNADLFIADLSGADLVGAYLSNANLNGGHLVKAQLAGADLSDADLGAADLGDANLNAAQLVRAQLHEANLNYANLTEANLTEANLSDANLIDANLSGGDLSGADLSDALLGRANLIAAHLVRAKLVGANLTHANLINVRSPRL